MKKIRVTYFALATVLSAASCSKEAAESDVIDWDAKEIYFKSSIADVSSSRADDMTLDHLESFQVTCFNTGDIKKDADGFLSTYFEDATFIRRVSPSAGVTYESSPAEGPRAWPLKGGLMKFFAFSPSRTVMAANNPVITDDNRSEYFNLINTSTETDSEISTAYRLSPVRVNSDISRQFDLITADASGERWKDFNNRVDLAFRHVVSQVELKAWGGGTELDYEIAGVRLGNPVVEGTFVFCDDANPALSGQWDIAGTAIKNKVEYLYKGTADIADNEETPEAGDNIFYINKDKHNTPESAESIMGLGGCAMVIPTDNRKWEGLADPNIDMIPYSTDKMYFSILMRVTNSKSGKQLYPYTDDKYDDMTVIHYAVDRSGVIVARLYPGPTDGTFFTDPGLQRPYVAAEGEETKEYGWATVPIDVNWSAGKRYVYTLNYTDGIGIHDPEDPAPGTPISGKEEISWGISVETWEYATKNEDYQPDVNVP